MSPQIHIEHTSDLGRRIRVNVAAATVDSQLKKKFADAHKHAKVDGFRPGKAPKGLVEQRYGQGIQEKVLQELVMGQLQETLATHQLEPAVRPEVTIETFAPGQDLQYWADFEVFPEITSSQYQALPVVRYVVDITETDVDEALQRMQFALRAWEPVERPAQKGDRVELTYELTVNDFSEKDKPLDVELGVGRLLDGFEAGLTGIQAGEKRTIEVQFPEDWRVKEHAGQSGVFVVHAKQIWLAQAHPINDAFAEKIGADSAKMEDIRAFIREALTEAVTHRNIEEQRNQVIDALMHANITLPVPQALLAEAMQQLHPHTVDGCAEDHDHTQLSEEANRRARFQILSRHIIRENNLHQKDLSNWIDQEVNRRLVKMGAGANDFSSLKSMYYRSEKLMEAVRDAAMVHAIADTILEKALFDEKIRSVNEVLGLSKE
jgi:trigger factor